MSFCRLPAELVLEILTILDPSSFYLCLQTCHLFRRHVLGSRRLLHHQLAKIPGPRFLPPDVAGDSKKLMQLFCKRAVQHLNHGIRRMVDSYVWKSTAEVKSKLNSIISYPAQRENSEVEDGVRPTHEQRGIFIVEVHPEEQMIKIYGVRRREMRNQFKPSLIYFISPDLLLRVLGTQTTATYKLVQVAVYRSCNPQRGQEVPELALLFQPTVSPVPEETVEACMRLIVLTFDKNFGPTVAETLEIPFNQSEEVITMALTGRNESVILYREFTSPYSSLRYRLAAHRVAYNESTGEKYMSYSNDKIKLRNRHMRGLGHGDSIRGLTIMGETIHLERNIFPLPNWYNSTLLRKIARDNNAMQAGVQAESETRVRATLIPNHQDFSNPWMGKILAVRHDHKNYSNPHDNHDDDEPFCVNSVLQFVIARRDGSARSVTAVEGVFLLKGVERPVPLVDHATGELICRTFNPDNENQLHQFIVAELDNPPDLHNLSSLGLKLAVSHCRSRIAMASWKTVKVWALDPQAFLDQEYALGSNYDSSLRSDFIYCAQQYYSCYKPYSWVLLKPIKLPSAGVIYKLEWRGSDELWGWCDEGVCMWNLGAGACGRRVVGWLGKTDDDQDAMEGSFVSENRNKGKGKARAD